VSVVLLQSKAKQSKVGKKKGKGYNRNYTKREGGNLHRNIRALFVLPKKNS
jgi:hypothetical protein